MRTIIERPRSCSRNDDSSFGNFSMSSMIRVVLDKGELAKPERGNLIQNGAFLRNRIGENDVEGREAIGSDEEQGFAEIEDLADFAGAEFGNAGQVEVAQ